MNRPAPPDRWFHGTVAGTRSYVPGKDVTRALGVDRLPGRRPEPDARGDTQIGGSTTHARSAARS